MTPSKEGVSCAQGQQEGTCPSRERRDVPEGFSEEGVQPHSSRRRRRACAQEASGPNFLAPCTPHHRDRGATLTV